MKTISTSILAGLFLLAVRPDGPVAAAETQLRAGIVGRQPRVLVLYSNERLLPANIAVDEAIRTTFESEFKAPVEFYIEFLDVDRFPGETQEERTREFLEDKYRERPPDVIIAVGGSALNFLIKHRAKLFTHVPVVYCGVEPKDLPKFWPDDLIVGIPQAVDVAETLELALRLQPDTRQVAIVDSINGVEITPADVAPLAAKVRFLWLTNRSISELRTELSGLPDHTVVFYHTMFRDPAGNTFTPRAALDQFAPASRVPIYGYYDTYLGHGIVGGSMITFETMGRTAAKIAIRILKGQKPEDATRGEMHVPTPMFDGRELKRWDIPESRLPSGSVVLFRKPPIWREHAPAVAVALGIVAVQAWLIARLLLQRRHRRRAESGLRESEQRFRSLADTAPVMIWMSGPDQKCNYFNQRWLDFTGRPPEAELGDGWIASVHPDDVDRRVLGYRDAFESRAALTVEYRLRRHDGQYRWILAQALPRLTASGEFLGYVGSCLDITDRRQAEDAARNLAHTQRLATIGELTAMIAHEINQPLGAILSNADAAELLLESENPPLDEIREILADIKKNDLRADTAIRRIRSLLRRREMRMEPLDLNATAADVLQLVAGDALRRRVGIRKEFANGLPLVLGDRASLEQVLLNLIFNAMDAMKDTPESDRYFAVRTKLDDDGSVEVAVTDNGCGIHPDRTRRLFESFYTTKEEGMGLGLSVARSIIVAHQGRIWAENNSGGGTIFHFTVPVAPISGLETERDPFMSPEVIPG